MTADSNTHPYAVWEHAHTGRILHAFPDTDLAAQFIINTAAGRLLPTLATGKPNELLNP